MNIAEKTVDLNVAKEFSRTPGPRFRTEGKFSGEEFRESLLLRLFAQARHEGMGLHVVLDGGYGYAPSFLEEAFGGLARIYGSELVASTLAFTSAEEPYLIEDIQNYIRKAGG